MISFESRVGFGNAFAQMSLGSGALMVLCLLLPVTQTFGEEVTFGNIHLVITREETHSHLDQDIAEIAKLCKKDWSLIEEFLEFNDTQRLEIRLHSGTFTAYGETYSFGGYTELGKNLIEYNLLPGMDKSGIGKHELIHMLLGHKYDYSRSRLLAEGFAVGIEDVLDGHSYRGMSIRENMLSVSRLSIESMVSDTGAIAEETFYPNAGRFVTWVLQRYGKSKAFQLYALSVEEELSMDLISSVLGGEWEDIERDFR